jgi:hypothetical protein
VRLGIPRPLLSATSNAVDVGRSRAIPYSTSRSGERETRLELATLTLARYRSYSVFGRGQKGPLNDYLPPISTGSHTDHTGSHADHTAIHADHKTPESTRKVVDVGENKADDRLCWHGCHSTYAPRISKWGGHHKAGWRPSLSQLAWAPSTAGGLPPIVMTEVVRCALNRPSRRSPGSARRPSRA